MAECKIVSTTITSSTTSSTTSSNTSSTTISPQEAKEIKAASKFADQQEKSLQKIIRRFEGMNKLKLLWESKVPKDSKRPYYFVSFTPSNRNDVIEEIKTYQKFYKQLSAAAKKICDEQEKTDEEREKPHEIVLAVKKKVDEMLAAARLGEKLTPSSTLYALHREFMARHKELEAMIKNIEIGSLKQNVNSVTRRWEESLTKINDLTKKLEGFEACATDINKKLGEMTLKYEQLTKQNEEVLESNKKLSSENALLLEWVRLEMEKKRLEKRK